MFETGLQLTGRLLAGDIGIPIPTTSVQPRAMRSRPETDGATRRGATARQSELLAILDAGPISPAELAHLSRQQQKRAEDGIAALIDLLDAIEPDPDLEPTLGFVMPGEVDEAEPDADLEPNLGAACFGSLWQDLWSRGDRRDLEEQCEDEGACIQSQPHDAEADEPSLGAPENHHDQTGWCRGGYNDAERDESDHEPSLGSLHNIDQQTWSQGSGSVEGDFDEVITPDRYERRERLRAARGVADKLLDQHRPGRRGDNIDVLVPIGPGVMWWPR